jgi:alpha-N-arabinofuranosidase
MATPLLDAEQLEGLRRYPTPTISNAIELFDVRPRDVGFLPHSIRALLPELGAIVGYAVTSQTSAVFDTTGLVLKMYRQHFGTIPVALTANAEPLDIAAAWTEDRRALTIAVVNPTASEQPVDLAVTGARVPPTARVVRIAGTSERACNVPGKAPEVAIEETTVPFGRQVTVPPMSASIYVLVQS